MLGRQMERILGTFRFNVLFSGDYLHVLGSLLVYVGKPAAPIGFGPDTQYLILSMFSCFAFMFQDAQFLTLFCYSH